MTKVLNFDGPNGSELFYQLYALYKQGVPHNKQRTREDVLTEAAIDDAFDTIAAPSYRDALALGTVPVIVQMDLDGFNAARKQQNGADALEITEPMVMAGVLAKFLRGGDAPRVLRMDPAREWKTLMASIDRSVPHTHPREVRRVRELLQFLEAAPTE